MAAFRLKLTGLPAGPMGRIYTINDNATGRILTAAKEVYGNPVMTDLQVTYRMFDDFIKDWLNKSFVKAKDVASATVVKDTSTPADDNT